MDWKLAMKEERAALIRIVALLFALADLAESTNRRCRPVRRFVLWLLRPAESLAQDFVIGRELSAALMPIGPAGDSPADATRLAKSFRDLACELNYQARLAFAIQDGAGQGGGLPRFGGYRTLDAHDFLNSLRSAVATVTCPEQFQEKWEPVFCPELRKNKPLAARATAQPDTS